MVPGTLPAEAPSSWRAAGDTPARLAYLEAMRQELRDKPDLSLAFHVAASAVLCDQPRLHWDLARIGCLLYGVIPSFAQRRGLRVQSAIELRTRIVALRTLPREAAIGYGAEFRTARETRLATLPVGLSHGVALLPESSVNLATGVRRLLVRYAGSRGRAYRAPLARLDAGEAPLVGRVSLNECTVDVTDLPGVSLGDEVSVPARMTTLNPSLPRVYVEAQD
jgi:alanine racemase